MTDLLRRRANDLSSYATELLNRGCEFGVDFSDIRELVDGLAVLYPAATYLLSEQELAPARKAQLSADPVLFYLHELVVEAHATRGEVPLWQAVERLRTFANLASNLEIQVVLAEAGVVTIKNGAIVSSSAD